jgi:hypothetical protein
LRQNQNPIGQLDNGIKQGYCPLKLNFVMIFILDNHENRHCFEWVHPRPSIVDAR